MAELINLRTARKRAKQRRHDARANANRLLHGQPKHQHKLRTEQRTKAGRDLDQHRIEKEDSR